MEGRYETGQRCLAGVILCCTSIPPEQREHLGSLGAQMGAVIKLDLTSDVTHLIVGNINSAKYRYVAKSREDVKVLSPQWLYAVNAVWMQGGGVDVAALENQYRSPTFHGLSICLTGFDDPEQRKYIQDTIVQNGAEYHGDLTKSVTHLIAAAPLGKKYEHATNWKMKIVTWEWFEQSVRRGMVLDESCYLPTMPIEERGRGAWDRRRSPSPTLGKRTREVEEAQLVNPLRRKLRRSASSKMGGQIEALWAGITAGGTEIQRNDEDEWTETAPAKTSLSTTTAPAIDANNMAGVQDGAFREDAPALLLAEPPHQNDGIFQGRLVFTYGFDTEKTNILQQHLASNGAMAAHNAADFDKFSLDDLKRGYLVIPHDVQSDPTSLPTAAETMALVTNWWVEQCLYSKSLVDPTEHVLCRPFGHLAINGFDGLIINSTAFMGIELLQVTKVIGLMGATYDGFLTTKTSVMVCNTWKTSSEKFKFTTSRHIPAVHATWLWECLRTGEFQPFDDYLLKPITLRPQPPRSSSTPDQGFSDIPALSKEDGLRLTNKKLQNSKHPSKALKARSRLGEPRMLDLRLSHEPSTNSAATSFARPVTKPRGPFVDEDEDEDKDDEDEPPIAPYDGPASLPLQDINPSVNSPRRPSTSSDASGTKLKPNTKSASTTRSNSTSDASLKPAPAPHIARPVKEPTPDSVIPPSTAPLKQEEKPKPPEVDHTGIMSNILAQRKAAAAAASLNNAEKEKKKRLLGRASSIRSNPSTGEATFSRTSSIVEEGDGEGTKKEEEVYQPSQELGWDTGGLVQGIGVVKDIVTDSGARTGRRRRL